MTHGGGSSSSGIERQAKRGSDEDISFGGVRKYQRYGEVEDDEDAGNLEEWQAYFEGKRTEKPGRNFQYLSSEKKVHMGKVCELFSPCRVGPHAERAGFRPGWSLDIAAECPSTLRKWDLSDEATQGEVDW